MKKSALIVEQIIRQCCQKHSINLDICSEDAQISFFFMYIRHDYSLCWDAFYHDYSVLQATDIVKGILAKIKQESK